MQFILLEYIGLLHRCRPNLELFYVFCFSIKSRLLSFEKYFFNVLGARSTASRNTISAVGSGVAMVLRALVQRYVMGPLVTKQLRNSFVVCQFTHWQQNQTMQLQIGLREIVLFVQS